MSERDTEPDELKTVPRNPVPNFPPADDSPERFARLVASETARTLEQVIDAKLDAFARSLGDQFDAKVRQLDANLDALRESMQSLRELVRAIHTEHGAEIDWLKREVAQLEKRITALETELAGYRNG